MLNCECQNYCWHNLDYYKTGGMFTEHHPRCEKFKPLEETKNHILALIKGIEEWAGEEDGIPDFLWEEYKSALRLVDNKKWIVVIKKEQEENKND